MNHTMTTALCPPAPIEAPELRLQPVESEDHILERYRRNAIGTLLRSHNLGIMPSVTPDPQALIVSCMDFRISLDLPEFFAFQVRTAGANPEPLLSNIAFAVACAGIRTIAVIGHDDCAMCRIDDTMDSMCHHLVHDALWNPDDAAKQAVTLRHEYRIQDPISASWTRARMLANRFPSVLVAPLHYRIDDGAILQVVEPGLELTD